MDRLFFHPKAYSCCRLRSVRRLSVRKEPSIAEESHGATRSHETKSQRVFARRLHCYESLLGHTWHHGDPEAEAGGVAVRSKAGGPGGSNDKVIRREPPSAQSGARPRVRRTRRRRKANAVTWRKGPPGPTHFRDLEQRGNSANEGAAERQTR